MPPNTDPSESTRHECPLCGVTLTEDFTQCSKCDWVKGYRNRKSLASGNSRDVIAACISIIPGLGHVYKGHTQLGMVLFAVTCILAFVGCTVFLMFFGPVLPVLFWIWVVFDAFCRKDLKFPQDS